MNCHRIVIFENYDFIQPLGHPRVDIFAVENKKVLYMTGNSAKLVVAGVNFRKTSLEIRNRFAFTHDKVAKIYQQGSSVGREDFFILSTCNRTEIYGITQHPEALINLFSEYNGITANEIENYCFIKSGDEAVRHLFRVASGLDSQIVGDHEIIGQLKKAFILAKGSGIVSGYMEKMVNSALQTSKQVKSQTALSDGTTSVSYAVIQLLNQAIADEAPLNVCLLGLGKMGTLTLKNLKHYLPQHKINVINRNQLKAELAAGEYQVDYTPFANQQEALNKADIVVVATGADDPIIYKADVTGTGIKIIFDLSVPSNVSADVREISHVQLYNIDELSKIVNQTIEQRKTEIPVAEAIVEKNFNEFRQWEERRRQYRSQAVLQEIQPGLQRVA